MNKKRLVSWNVRRRAVTDDHTHSMRLALYYIIMFIETPV